MTILKFKTTQRKSGKYDYTENTWDLSSQLDINEFLNNNPEFTFEKVGKIVKNLKNKCGFIIEVTPEWKNKKFVLYILTIDGKIVKGGKSKNQLHKRSYGAGTEYSWAITGQSSPTNYIYSQIFRECLVQNIPVEFYCLQAPYAISEFDVFGEKKIIETSPYEEMESILNKKLIQTLGRNPIGDGKLLEQFKN
jgi:hypothetical protein